MIRRSSGALVALAAWLLGCGPATGGDAEFWAATPGAGGAQSGAASGGSPSTGSTGSGGSSPGQLAMSLRFNTVSFGGEYAPDNVGAVSIGDEQGVFVKTLEVWAAKRIKYLYTWHGASAGNTVDAVTGPTRGSHGVHDVAWDGTDVTGAVVSDGAYRVYLELTEHNKLGIWTTVSLTKGADALDLSPPDHPNFTGFHLVYTP